MLGEYRFGICTEWRCDEVDGECDWHTYLYIGSGSGGSTEKQKVDGAWWQIQII